MPSASITSSSSSSSPPSIHPGFIPRSRQAPQKAPARSRTAPGKSGLAFYPANVTSCIARQIWPKGRNALILAFLCLLALLCLLTQQTPFHSHPPPRLQRHPSIDMWYVRLNALTWILPGPYHSPPKPERFPLDILVSSAHAHGREPRIYSQDLWWVIPYHTHTRTIASVKIGTDPREDARASTTSTTTITTSSSPAHVSSPAQPSFASPRLSCSHDFFHVANISTTRLHGEN